MDELYQYKVKLVCTASEWPHALFNYEKQSDDETQERFASYYADVDDFSHAQDDQSQVRDPLKDSLLFHPRARAGEAARGRFVILQSCAMVARHLRQSEVV